MSLLNEDIESPHSKDLELSSHPAGSEALAPTTSIGASLNEVETNPYGSRPACFSNALQECLFVLTTTFAIGMSSIFSGAIICITNYIGKDLNMTSAEVTWLSTAQTLSAGTFLLFFGRVADLFGRRLLLLFSLAFFTISLLIMGFATNAYYIDIFCGLLGISSAAAVPPAIGKLGAVYHKPSRRKNWAFACFSAGNPVGFAIGAFIAGVSMQVSTWRAVFWSMAVVYAAFTVVAFFTVPPDVEQNKGGFNRETFAQFDFVGALLVIIGLAMFTASLTLAGDAPDGWRTNYVIALLVIGVGSTAAFIYWQSIFKHPLMPLYIWRDRNFTLLVSTLCLAFYGFSGNIFWITLLWQRIYHLSPLEVAIRLLPMAIGGIVVNIVAAIIMHRVSNKLMMVIGALSMVLSSALLSAMSEDDSYWAFAFPAFLLAVISSDFEFTVTNMYVMSAMPADAGSIAGGIFNTASRLAATVGIGVQTSIFNGLGGSAQGAGATRWGAYRGTFIFSAGGAALALLLVPFLTIKSQGAKQKKDPEKRELDNRKDVPVRAFPSERTGPPRK